MLKPISFKNIFIIEFTPEANCTLLKQKCFEVTLDAYCDWGKIKKYFSLTTRTLTKQ